MANDFTSNPIILDTAGATSASPARQGGYKITKILWDDPSTAGHTFVLHNAASGLVLVQGTAQADNQMVQIDFPNPFRVQSFYLTTLASGKLLIYLTPQHSPK